jgi:hypothetical protein
VTEALAESVLRKLRIGERNVRFPRQPVAEPAAAPEGAAEAEPAFLPELRVVGEHVVEIEARPGFWCSFMLTLESS